MAEEKKQGKEGKEGKEKRESAGDSNDPLIWIIALLFAVVVLGRLSLFIPEMIEAFRVSFIESGGYSFFGKTHRILKGILSFTAFISIVGISFVFLKYTALVRKQSAKLISLVPKPSVDTSEEEWMRIVRLAHSRSPADRKLAIIEADNILDAVVTRLGYSGDTVGEKLKNIEESEFATLNDAWEAHKVRNEIAHENIDISREDAIRVIMLYERVFREFEYI